MATPPEYQRMRGSGRRRAQFYSLVSVRNSVWLAPDHLLSVDDVFVNERYKRFFFRDVEAILIRRTWKSLLRGSAFGLLVLLASALLILAQRMPPSPRQTSMVVWGGIIGTLGSILLIFEALAAILLGSSCRFYVRTAVQTEELVAFSRWRNARLAVEVLRPRILASQEEAARVVPGSAPSSGSPGEVVASPGPEAEPV